MEFTEKGKCLRLATQGCCGSSATDCQNFGHLKSDGTVQKASDTIPMPCVPREQMNSDQISASSIGLDLKLLKPFAVEMHALEERSKG